MAKNDIDNISEEDLFSAFGFSSPSTSNTSSKTSSARFSAAGTTPKSATSKNLNMRAPETARTNSKHLDSDTLVSAFVSTHADLSADMSIEPTDERERARMAQLEEKKLRSRQWRRELDRQNEQRLALRDDTSKTKSLQTETNVREVSSTSKVRSDTSASRTRTTSVVQTQPRSTQSSQVEAVSSRVQTSQPERTSNRTQAGQPERTSSRAQVSQPERASNRAQASQPRVTHSEKTRLEENVTYSSTSISSAGVSAQSGALKTTPLEETTLSNAPDAESAPEKRVDRRHNDVPKTPAATVQRPAQKPARQDVPPENSHQSSVSALGVALIIIAVLCVLVAISLLSGLWDISNL